MTSAEHEEIQRSAYFVPTYVPTGLWNSSPDLLVSDLPILFLPGSFQPSHLLPRDHVYTQLRFLSLHPQ